MDEPTPVDLTTWPRRQHFEHYRDAVPCVYAMTVEVDVTRFVETLHRSPRSSYLAQIWALASVVNRREEFRMTLIDGRAPAVHAVSHPMFTVFHPATETFSAVWTPFDPDFAAFHDGAAETLARHRESADLFPQGIPPANVFDVSSIPWASFTGFTIGVRDGGDHLAPIFTLGRYVEREARTLLPLAVQIHHAAADGFHTARLVTEVQDLLAHPEWAA